VVDRLVRLLLAVGLGVHRVPVVLALIEELARRHLARQLEQPVQVGVPPDVLHGARHGRQMGKPDLTCLERLHAL